MLFLFVKTKLRKVILLLSVGSALFCCCHITIEIVITVSSIEAQQVDSHNKPDNFVTRLDKPIELDRNKIYFVGLDSGIMHYSWYNISSEHNNNKIEYKATEDDPYKTITFTPGMFDYEDIQSYIDEWLKLKELLQKRI